MSHILSHEFFIRDLLLVTVIVALAMAWYVDRSRLAASWKAAESESQKATAAYKESVMAWTQIVEELEKRGVATSTVKGKIVIGPESAFAP